MALMKDGLWGIVNGNDLFPQQGGDDTRRKFTLRSDRALAIIKQKSQNSKY